MNTTNHTQDRVTIDTLPRVDSPTKGNLEVSGEVFVKASEGAIELLGLDDSDACADCGRYVLPEVREDEKRTACEPTEHYCSQCLSSALASCCRECGWIDDYEAP